MDDYYETFYRFLCDGIYQIFVDEFNRSKIIKSSYNYLQNFQIVLQQVPLWTHTVCEKKWESICKLCGYECLEEYMKIVIVTKMKFLIEHCMEDEKEVDDMIASFKCPTKEDFLRDVLASVARHFYQNPFLFKISNYEETQVNKERIKNIVTENIKLTIQKYLPSKIIAKKCNPEELLKRKKTVYTSTGSQCETTESQSQIERRGNKYWGSEHHPPYGFPHHVHYHPRSVYGDFRQYPNDFASRDYYRDNHSTESFGKNLDTKYPAVNTRHVAQIEAAKEKEIPNVKTMMNLRETRSPSPEYIRNAHEQLYTQAQANQPLSKAFSDISDKQDFLESKGNRPLTPPDKEERSLQSDPSLDDSTFHDSDQKFQKSRSSLSPDKIQSDSNQKNVYKKNSDIITVTVPQHVIDKAHSAILKDTHSDSDPDREFSSQSANAFHKNKTLSISQLGNQVKRPLVFNDEDSNYSLQDGNGNGSGSGSGSGSDKTRDIKLSDRGRRRRSAPIANNQSSHHQQKPGNNDVVHPIDNKITSVADEDSSESLLSFTHNSPLNAASKIIEKNRTTRPQSEYVHKNNAKKSDAQVAARRGRLNESQSVQTSDIDTSPDITTKNIIKRYENIRSTKGDDLQTTDEEENYKYRNSRAVVLKDRNKRKKRKLFRLP